MDKIWKEQFLLSGYGKKGEITLRHFVKTATNKFICTMSDPTTIALNHIMIIMNMINTQTINIYTEFWYIIFASQFLLLSIWQALKLKCLCMNIFMLTIKAIFPNLWKQSDHRKKTWIETG